jgi:PAP2 superfamily
MTNLKPFPVLRTFATVSLIAGAFAFGLSHYFYAVIHFTLFPWIAFLGCTIIQLRYRFRLVEFACTLAFAAVCLATVFLWWHVPLSVDFIGAYAGLGSLLVLSVVAIWASEETRPGYLAAVIPAIVLVGSEWLTPPLLQWTQAHYPRTLDLYLLVFDSTLGFQPSFLMGRLFKGVTVLRYPSVFIYVGLPLLIALVYVEQLRLNQKRALVTLAIFFFAAILGAAAYNLYPACGPHTLLANNFPTMDLPSSQAAHILLEPVPISGPRNAMPSMHMSWVLLAWWLSKNLSKPVKFVGICYLVFTFTATLGTGEHYFIDLIVALPFSLCMYALFSLDLPLQQRERLLAFVGGLLGFLLWIVLLRYEIPLFLRIKGFSWLLIVLTIALVTLSQRALTKARALAAT